MDDMNGSNSKAVKAALHATGIVQYDAQMPLGVALLTGQNVRARRQPLSWGALLGRAKSMVDVHLHGIAAHVSQMMCAARAGLVLFADFVGNSVCLPV